MDVLNAPHTHTATQNNLLRYGSGQNGTALGPPPQQGLSKLQQSTVLTVNQVLELVNYLLQKRVVLDLPSGQHLISSYLHKTKCKSSPMCEQENRLFTRISLRLSSSCGDSEGAYSHPDLQKNSSEGAMPENIYCRRGAGNLQPAFVIMVITQQSAKNSNMQNWHDRGGQNYYTQLLNILELISQCQ